MYVKKKKKCFWDFFSLSSTYLTQNCPWRGQENLLVHPNNEFSALVSWWFVEQFLIYDGKYS